MIQVKLKLMPCVRFWKTLCKNENFNEYTALKNDDEDVGRITFTEERFHDVELPDEATSWHKIFLRGMQMRRNICSGRYV